MNFLEELQNLDFNDIGRWPVVFHVFFVVLFFVVRASNKLRHGHAPALEAPRKHCHRCDSEVSGKATRCPHCTSDIPAPAS